MGHPPKPRTDIVSLNLSLVASKEVLGDVTDRFFILFRDWPALSPVFQQRRVTQVSPETLVTCLVGAQVFERCV